MSSRKHVRFSRGFSMIEVVSAVSIVGLVVSLGVPAFTKLKRSDDLYAAAGNLSAQLSRARMLAGSGYRAGLTPWTATDRTKSAGVRVASTTRYTVFVDRDSTTNGDELDVVVVDLTRISRDAHVTLVSPAPGSEVRFRANGTARAAVTFELLENDSRRRTTVTVTSGGQVSVR